MKMIINDISEETLTMQKQIGQNESYHKRVLTIISTLQHSQEITQTVVRQLFIKNAKKNLWLKAMNQEIVSIQQYDIWMLVDKICEVKVGIQYQNQYNIRLDWQLKGFHMNYVD